jgi:hypothetical protein
MDYPELELDIPMPEVKSPKPWEERSDIMEILIGATKAGNAIWRWNAEGHYYFYRYNEYWDECFILHEVMDPFAVKSLHPITYRLMFDSGGTQNVWEGDFYQEALEDLYVSIEESNLKRHRACLDHVLEVLYDKNMKEI